MNIQFRSDARTSMTIAILLCLALLVNYIDRGSISVAAPLLRTEFALTPSQMGWVLSAFFWTYVLFQPINGALVDRFGAERVLAGGLAVWSLATVMAGLTTGLLGLITFRLLMGASESVFYPSALSILATRVPDSFRARATGIMQVGSYVGPFLGILVGGAIMNRYGWRVMLLGLGVLSLLWLLPWIRIVGLRRPVSRDPVVASTASYRQILGQRALWASMLGTFCGNYMFYLMFTWMLLYLKEQRGLSLQRSELYSVLFYVGECLSLLVSGWLIDRWIARGASANRAYKTALGISCSAVCLCMLACRSTSLTALPLLLFAIGVADGLAGPSNCSITQIMAGPIATGRWMGLQNAVGNIAGISAPIITGYVVESTGNYNAAFIVASAIALIGVLAWLIIMPRVAPVRWTQPHAL